MIKLFKPFTRKAAPLLMAAFMVPAIGFTQTVDFDKVVTPDGFRAKTFEEHLVQLAWMNSPENKVLDYEVAIAKEEKKIQRFDWTKDLTAQFNYNEAHFVNDFFPAPVDDDTDPLVQSLIFPRFNLGARFDLGTILNYKKEKQISHLKVLIAESTVDQGKLEVRAKVLEQYKTYVGAEEILAIRVQAEQDSKESYQLASSLFKAGEAKFEEFTAAATSYFAAKESTLNARIDIELTRVKLEELIGVSLEAARKSGPKELKKKKKN